MGDMPPRPCEVEGRRTRCEPGQSLRPRPGASESASRAVRSIDAARFLPTRSSRAAAILTRRAATSSSRLTRYRSREPGPRSRGRPDDARSGAPAEAGRVRPAPARSRSRVPAMQGADAPASLRKSASTIDDPGSRTRASTRHPVRPLDMALLPRCGPASPARDRADDSVLRVAPKRVPHNLIHSSRDCRTPWVRRGAEPSGRTAPRQAAVTRSSAFEPLQVQGGDCFDVELRPAIPRIGPRACEDPAPPSARRAGATARLP